MVIFPTTATPMQYCSKWFESGEGPILHMRCTQDTPIKLDIGNYCAVVARVITVDRTIEGCLDQLFSVANKILKSNTTTPWTDCKQSKGLCKRYFSAIQKLQENDNKVRHDLQHWYNLASVQNKVLIFKIVQQAAGTCGFQQQWELLDVWKMETLY